MCQTKQLKQVIGSTINGVTKASRTLHNEKINNLYYLTNISNFVNLAINTTQEYLQDEDKTGTNVSLLFVYYAN